MTNERVRVLASTSQRIIAGAMVLGFCYYAAGVIVTVLLSVLLAYFLDPIVEWFERLRMPRVIGSLVVVLLVVSLCIGVGYYGWVRAEQFAGDWPRYSAVLRAAAATVERKLESLEARVSEIAPAQPEAGRPTVELAEPSRVRAYLLRGLGSLYNILLEVAFVPFLVFFMLAEKRDVWHATLQLFPASERTRVKEALESVRDVLRSFMAGTALVAVVLIIVSAAVFWMLDMDYPILAGIVSGVLNMVPYIGVVLACVPPFIIGLAQWQGIGVFLLVAILLVVFHILAMNLLIPELVGRRVRLNALAVTFALLFWGWLWGVMGLILAIPITATMKVICDHTESWRPVGRWLGA
jgi:predicted PurR-regulated permease PerM